MWTTQARVLDDVTPAAWLAPRLGGAFGAVARTVPRGFAAYARILHPADDEDGEPVRWSEVAMRTGRQVHATAQWHVLVGSHDRWSTDGGLWPYGPPEQGNLHLDPLLALCDVLAGHTTTPDTCYFCLWEGWGWLHGSPAVARATFGPGKAEPVPPALTPDELQSPRVVHPGRSYLLLRGPLSATEALARYEPECWGTQSPNLFWPADRSWCVASEIDFDSTLVGGSTALVDELLRSPDLEAWPIGPDDSLAYDADTVNVLPGPAEADADPGAGRVRRAWLRARRGSPHRREDEHDRSRPPHPGA